MPARAAAKLPRPHRRASRNSATNLVGREGRRLGRHSVLDVENVRHDVPAAGADRILGSALADQLSAVERAECRQRATAPQCARETAGRLAEVGDCRDVLGNWGRHLRAGQIDHRRALGVSAQHNLGAGAAGHGALDVSTRIVRTARRALVVIVVRRVVHRVDLNGTPGKIRGEQVDERLAHVAESWLLMGPTSKDDRDVGARVGRGGRTRRWARSAVPTSSRRRH